MPELPTPLNYLVWLLVIVVAFIVVLWALRQLGVAI
jgi:hypothetical protein